MHTYLCAQKPNPMIDELLTSYGLEFESVPADPCLATMPPADAIVLVEEPDAYLDDLVRQWRAGGLESPIVLMLKEPTPEAWERASAAGCNAMLDWADDGCQLASTLDWLTRPKPSLLLITDDPAFAARARKTLSDQFAVRWVTNGQEAAATLASKHSYAVVVADIDRIGTNRSYDLLMYFQRYAPDTLARTAILLYSADSRSLAGMGGNVRMVSGSSLQDLSQQAQNLLEQVTARAEQEVAAGSSRQSQPSLTES
jgi:CheY-like chemotaxis protein